MNQKAHVVTIIDADAGPDVKEVFTFSSRAKAVAKMKALYKDELEKQDTEEFYCDFCNPPFIPYCRVGAVIFNYFATDIQ